MSTIPADHRPTAGHPAVVALSIFMAGLVVMTLIFVWASRLGSDAASAVPVAAAADPNVVIPSYHTPAPSPAAVAREPFPAELPPLQASDRVEIAIALTDVTVEIAPGVRYSSWTFAGGAPGPAIHVRQGQTVHVTLTNEGAIPHSIDFHAARVAPNVAFKDVAPGESFDFEFVAGDPGVFMYHCGTPPVLAHIANGMYGAIVVEPAGGWQPKADRSYVMVSSEWYLNGDGTDQPATLDLTKARQVHPDYVTWNGYAAQYKDHPLPAEQGENIRFFVVAAGPSLDTAFHIVGTVMDRAWPDGDPTHVFRGVQTMNVPAGGGAVFDAHFDDDGFYPFVSHSFASVDLGQVGLVKVGDPAGTASH